MSTCVYKYRSWDNKNHQNSFKKNHLYFASPEDFNDPFDFKISVDYSRLDTYPKREKYVNQLLNDGISILIKNHINPIERRIELIERLLIDEEKMQAEFEVTRNKWISKRIGVVSLSTVWDSILMWSHYASHHQGFCIGYDRELLERSDIYGTAGVVHYSERYPSIDPLNNKSIESIIVESHTKATDWSYEKEYRLTKLWDSHDPTSTERLIRVDAKVVKEVVLGMKISPKHEKVIRRIAEKKEINVFKIKAVAKEFRLERE